jgi:hypothetical protein
MRDDSIYIFCIICCSTFVPVDTNSNKTSELFVLDNGSKFRRSRLHHCGYYRWYVGLWQFSDIRYRD